MSKVNDILDCVRQYAESGKLSADEILERFPELKESEDERIRKELMNFVAEVKDIAKSGRDSWAVRKEDVEMCERFLAYLDKQKEQKPIPKFKVGDRIYDKRDSYNRNVIREVGKDYYINAFAQKMDMAYTDANFEFLEHLDDDIIPNKPAEMDNEEIELSDFESVLFSAFSDGWQQYLHGEEVDVAQWAKEHSAELLNAAKLELKPAEWSEEDEKDIQEASDYLRDYANNCVRGGNSKLYIQSLADRIESLHPQHQSPSLSDKEILCLKRALDYLRKEHNRYAGEDFTNEIAVLEYLITHPVMVYPSQPHWKPSEEQMEWLESAVKLSTDKPHIHGIIISLYEQLKRL